MDTLAEFRPSGLWKLYSAKPGAAFVHLNARSIATLENNE
jgi:hypothetical protein